MTLDHGRQRMWLLHRLFPEGTALNLGLALELSGNLDVDRLDRAVRIVANAHPILRATYTEDRDGSPVAHIDEHGGGIVSIGQIDSRDRLEPVIRREFGHVFDLQREHSVRVSLVKVDPSTHILLVVAHHIAWDDGCWTPYLSMLTGAYEGKEPVAPAQHVPVPPSPESVEYWRVRLASLPEPIEFPGENGLTRSARTDSAILSVSLSAESTAALVALTESIDSSVAEILLTAFEIVVSRYCRTRDMAIALPVERRADPAAAGRIGYSGNTIVLRAKIDPLQPIAELLHQVAGDHRRALRHADVELDDIVRRANPDRDAGANSAVRLCFSERRPPTALFEPPGITARILSSDVGHSQVPLSFEFEMGEQCVLRIEYQTDVLSDAVVRAMLGSLHYVLDGAVRGDLQVPVADVRLFTSSEREEILAHSRGRARHAEPSTMPDLCARQSASNPDADVVVDDTTALSYRALDRRSTAFASELVRVGVEPGATVATLLPHSIELVVAALGIMKAGAVYLPLDAGLPAARLQYVVGDAQPAAMVGDVSVLDVGTARVLDASVTDLPGISDVRLPEVRPTAPAYVVYTSASTGPPKGVVVSHSAIVEYIEWIIENGRLGKGDSVLQVASPGFDVSIGEIFGCLGSGARLVVPRPGGLADMGYLTELLRTRDISSMHFVPSLLATFLTLPGVERWTSLRRVPVGGEPFPGPLADQFNAMFDARLYNFYGPTEATLAVTQYEVVSAQGRRVVPIGMPKDNTQVYVLDERLQPVGVGVIGELYVGGTQLATAYHGRPGLTAARFVANPFCSGGRLYRTGDLGRWTRDSGLEFIGRVDQQVKVRGFRIERSEVEAVVAAVADVAQVFVDVVNHPVRGTALVAYVVAEEDTQLEQRVRTAAAALLPDYMIPERIVVVDRIPVTSNGKLDRASLPSPDFRAPTSGRGPETDTERALCAIFTWLVGRDEIDVDDSFFDVGGHSLSVVRLVARVRAEFGVDVSVRQVFSSPTVAALAEIIDLAVIRLRRPLAALRPAITPIDDDLGSPLFASQLEIWSAHCDEVDATDNVAFGAELTGPIDAPSLERALEDLVRRHRVLRTAYPAEDGVPRRALVRSIPVLLQSNSSDTSRNLLWQAAKCRIEITDSLPIRAQLVARSEEQYLLILVVHHIACDEWSSPVLFADLATAYRARRVGSAPAWAPLVVQYADFAAWQARLPSVGEQTAYWRHELSASTTTLRPTGIIDMVDLAPDSLLLQQFDSIASRIDDELAAAILVTAALSATLTGDDDIVVWTPTPERVPEEADGMIGPLVNTIAVRTRLTGSDDMQTILSHIAERVSAGMDHNDVSPGAGVPSGVVVMMQQPSDVRVRFGPSAVLVSLPAVRPAGTPDMTIVFRRESEGLACRIEYRRDRYAGDRLISLLQQIVRDLADESARPIGASARLIRAKVSI